MVEVCVVGDGGNGGVKNGRGRREKAGRKQYM